LPALRSPRRPSLGRRHATLFALNAGPVPVVCEVPSSIAYIKAGRLRALAVTTATRSGALPDIPTVGEFLPGYEASQWVGIGAPKNTPDLEIVVFNGHVHTTELYDVDGVKYLLLGGGGAEQDPILPRRTAIKVPANYPPDLYWKGQPPKEEYNYLLVDVQPGQKTKFTLNRFRPWSGEPFATVDLFK
jgi:Tripartite tricarboxylate transporter family receptor